MHTPTIPVLSTKPINFVPLAQLDDLPGIEWLIEDVLPAQGIATLYGAPGVGKSFVAIDWANHIAAGAPWNGKKVLQGTVVYIVAEGSRGMRDRMLAWRTAHPDKDVSKTFVVLEPIMLHDPSQLNRFTNAVQDAVRKAALPDEPVLFVLDTLAQNFVGGDENSAQDMGVWLHGARLLQEKFKASVLIVHHSTKNTGAERGSTALRGACDAMIQMSRPASTVNGYKMSCTKMKDGECFNTVSFIIDPVEGTRSAVLKLAPASNSVETVVTPHSDPLEKAVATIAASGVSLTQATKDLRAAFPSLTEAAAKSRIHRARQKKTAAPTPPRSLDEVEEIAVEMVA